MGVEQRLVLLALSMAFWLPLILDGCSSTTPAPVYGWNWQGPAPDGFYRVRKGDSLSVVAQRLGIGTRKLVKWNGLKPPYLIYADTLLRVVPPNAASSRRIAKKAVTPPRKPDVTPESRSKSSANAVAAIPKETREDAPRRRPETSGITWEWPLDGPLMQGFQASDRTRQGIRIGGRSGAQVRASADGWVVYSGGGLKGYGNLIIIKHNDRYLSAYGFNRSLFVKEGDRVTRGQAVAEVGQGAEGTHLLHFEVRLDGTAVDPIAYLPPRN
ncbi:peptidase M23 [Thiocystis minor]|uniref:peptidoglycan DD-metalloendopeptidase family protein n=1 Tax=Thiocystis minor TaxID=61597 RepID=UPI00191172D1|nr:peptidoglycan DD-metalloendopeptidase family protein [Thiocystis minor]MBK5964248.1 peptidase M23 [Thiocystis minor]